MQERKIWKGACRVSFLALKHQEAGAGAGKRQSRDVDWRNLEVSEQHEKNLPSGGQECKEGTLRWGVPGDGPTPAPSPEESASSRPGERIGYLGPHVWGWEHGGEILPLTKVEMSRTSWEFLCAGLQGLLNFPNLSSHQNSPRHVFKILSPEDQF